MVATTLVAAAICLIAADPVWETKSASQWTEEDARQVLAKSTWSRPIRAVITRRLTEEQLREGGQLGQPRSIGNEAGDPKVGGLKVSPNILTSPGGGDRSPRPQSITLQLRWESALPVRLAELKLHEIETSHVAGRRLSHRRLRRSGRQFQGPPEQLGQPLKNLAALKREGKKDVRPVRVEVFLREDGAVVVYLFPCRRKSARTIDESGSKRRSVGLSSPKIST